MATSETGSNVLIYCLVAVFRPCCLAVDRDPTLFTVSCGGGKRKILIIIIESGFVGLSATLLFLFLLFRRLGREGLPLFWFLMSGTLVSNALLQRPILATLFWLAVAISALRIDNKLQISWREKQKQRPLQRPQTTHPRRQHRHGVGPNPKPAK